MDEIQNKRLIQWIDYLQSIGKNSFSLKMVQEQLTNMSRVALKSALNRLSKKGIILSIHKGFYIVIAPQYKSRGIIPPTLYLDALMSELKRPYYLSLLNAASFYGAAHQQPQEFFVVTNFPVLRPTIKKNLRVNYISKTKLPENLITIKNTESGFLKISNPILTAVDLIQFEKKIGGLNRVAEILVELVEKIHLKDFDSYVVENIHTTTLQRFGFLLENILDKKDMADVLFDLLKKNKNKLFKIQLSSSLTSKTLNLDQRWKVIVNFNFDLDTQ